jgi:hypothetical protein
MSASTGTDPVLSAKDAAILAASAKTKQDELNRQYDLELARGLNPKFDRERPALEDGPLGRFFGML